MPLRETPDFPADGKDNAAFQMTDTDLISERPSYDVGEASAIPEYDECDINVSGADSAEGMTSIDAHAADSFTTRCWGEAGTWLISEDGFSSHTADIYYNDRNCPECVHALMDSG